MTTGLVMMDRMDTTLTHPAGITVRAARPSDLPALHALLDRCSRDTLYRRFHGVVGRSVRRELARIATPTATHRSWVAVDGQGAVRGTATLAWARTGEVEVAFLVEDGFRRRGIGRALVTEAGHEAAREGVSTVEAHIQGDNAVASRFVRAVVPDASLRFRDGMTVGSIPVAAGLRSTAPVHGPGPRRALPARPAPHRPVRSDTHQEVA
jgi:N-acetylglutamate synthase-like GNAT family acetyltransferase